jgi:gamma-glutamylputrescine oxidase
MKPLLLVYPQLRDVKIDYAWGGTLAITMTRMPNFLRDGSLFSVSGYSGHGVAMATLAGKMLAQAVQGNAADFDVMTRHAPPPFPGGAGLRSPLLAAAMTWYALRDRLGV